MSKIYRPRRASLTRWLTEAPDYILDVFDNKGVTCDRYTVMFTGDLLLGDGTFTGTRVVYLGLSENPAHPQGFSQWGELSSWEAAAYRYRSGKCRIRWLDLPAAIRAHVITRAAPEPELDALAEKPTVAPC